MNIIRMKVGDKLILKKPHPCKCHEFLVLRVGSDVRIQCTGCKKDMTLDRLKLEKAVKQHIPSVIDGE